MIGPETAQGQLVCANLRAGGFLGVLDALTDVAALATLAGPSDLAAATMLCLHQPLVWTGDEQPTRAAEAVAMLSALPDVGGIAAIMAPTGPADTAGIAALAACRLGFANPSRSA